MNVHDEFWVLDMSLASRDKNTLQVVTSGRFYIAFAMVHLRFILL